jgi:hypothetical protein
MAYDIALRIVGTSRDEKGNSNAMTKQVGACCSSPAAICYWFIVSLMAWGVLSLVGIYWRLSMLRQRLRAFSPWPLAASPTGLEIALFTVLSLAHYF